MAKIYTDDATDEENNHFSVTGTTSGSKRLLDVNIGSSSGDVEVVQPTHDDLNANANIQVGDVDVSAGNPVPVSDAGGSITVDNTNLDTPLSTLETTLNSIESQQLADGHNVTVDNAAGASAVNVQDGGNSLTVDDGGTTLSVDDGAGSITIDNVNLDAPLSTIDSVLDSILAGQLADGHNVTVDNAAGASAVNIQDGGNSITVDNAGLTSLDGAISGTEVQVDVVGALPAGTNNIGDVDVLTLPDVTQSTHDNLNANANLQVGNTDVSQTNPVITFPRQLAVQTDDAGSGITYLGKAVPGTATSAASWLIKRITDTANDISIEYADGNASFDNIWDNRAALSYS